MMFPLRKHARLIDHFGVITVKSFIEEQNAQSNNAYHAKPSLLREHHGQEETVLAGGYGYRQVLELIQNAADAILEQPLTSPPINTEHRIHVLLHGAHLYVANTGEPLSKDGVESLLSAHLSSKRANQIGRFGLGFKSLLGIASHADFFSKHWGGIIRFDPKRCQVELAKEHGIEPANAPRFRLGWFLENDDHEDVAVLESMSWAETIVRVALFIDQETYLTEKLQQEIEDFRAEFLLFFPVSTILELDNARDPVRNLRVEPDEDVCLLHDGEKESVWILAKQDILIRDERAIYDATHIHARETVPVIWAYPQEGRYEKAGAFWAFFPTNTPTYLPGILNAPWKLSSDRNTIIGGEWNTALMREAAPMIAETMRRVSTLDDPGRILDVFPRQMDRKDIATPLVDELWSIIGRAAMIPDATGLLRPAAELWRHPRGNPALAAQWADLATEDVRARFTHSSCLIGQRGSRLNALEERLSPLRLKVGNELPCLQQKSVADWFSDVASSETVRASKTLKLAAAFHEDSKPEEWRAVRNSLAIIPSDKGDLLTADKVIFAPEGTAIPGDRHPVSRELAEIEDARNTLSKIMGVKQLDDSVWHSVLLENCYGVHLHEELREIVWGKFWQLLRSAPETVATDFCQRKASLIYVKRRDGAWDRAENVTLLGTIVHADEAEENCKVLVDESYHSADGKLLKALGISGVANFGSDRVPSDWLRLSLDFYYACLDSIGHSGSRPRRDLLRAASIMPNGWASILQLSEMPKVRLSEYLFQFLLLDHNCAQRVAVHHTTQENKYPIIPVDPPLLFVLRNLGRLRVGNTVVKVSAVLRLITYEFICQMEAVARFLPQLRLLNGINGIYVTDRPSDCEIKTLWLQIIELHKQKDVGSLAALWVAAARDGIAPSSVYYGGKSMPLNEVYVTESADMAQLAGKRALPVVRLDAATRGVWMRYGARDLNEQMKPVWQEEPAVDTLLVSVIPEVIEVIKSSIGDNLRAKLVHGLGLNIAGVMHPLPCLMQPEAMLLDLEQCGELPRLERLRLILKELDDAGALCLEFSAALDLLCNEQREGLRAHVKAGESLSERLLRAVGGRKEPLIQALGKLGELEFIQQCTLEKLSEVVLSHLGTATLVTLKEALQAEGLMPPKHWHTDKAREFVDSIGFPLSYAVSTSDKPEPEVYVSGPIDLPPLHDFQEEVFSAIGILVKGSVGKRRAVISLPTGGGKTRVAVQAAVVHVLKPACGPRCVLWIAQTEELCEQAVQAFVQVWVNLGAKRTELRIIRLWGGSANPTAQDLDKPVVVVASIQTLNARMNRRALDWFQEPGLVVMDECHHAIAPSYTRVLRWLNADAQRPGSLEREEPPLIGLSATPFRVDDDESERLAKRFDNRWFPSDQANLHQRLFAQQVLAKPHSEALASNVALTAEEVEALSRIPVPWESEGWDLANILERINKRLAGDAGRNDIMLHQIAEADENSILFFANSVLHSAEMAARLNLSGISAAAISGETPTAARRDFLSRFQNGEIRVLCNHSVLTTGFDAPKTDMILISRAVFSPVRYMQMVGRGLRGVRNGGTPSCRIITVLDNLGRFQDRHPYHYCRRYFSEWSE